MIYTNHSGIAFPLAVFLATDYYDTQDSQTISATTLLKPIRQIILSKRIDPTTEPVDIASLVASRLGSAIHDSIEKAWTTNHKQALSALGLSNKIIDNIKVNPTKEELKPNDIPVYLEQRVSKPMANYKVSGKFDFVAEGTVHDFKSTSVYTYINQSNAEKYALQGSIYRWLNPELINQDYMYIHYIFTDWSSAQAKQSNDYPNSRLLTQKYPLKSLQETEKFIKNKINLIQMYEDTDEKELPLCTDEELWRKPTQYKYYANPEAKRATKNFDNISEAYAYMSSKGAGKGIVKEVKGSVSACKYCSAFSLCSQKDSLIATGELIL